MPFSNLNISNKQESKKVQRDINLVGKWLKSFGLHMVWSRDQPSYI